MAYTLKQWRVLNDMTQKDLAAYLGISEGAISKWEKGDSAPRVKHLQMIAKLYGISMDDIIVPKTLT